MQTTKALATKMSMTVGEYGSIECQGCGGDQAKSWVWEGLPDCEEEMNTQEKEHQTKKKCHLTFRTHRWEAEQDQLKSKEETKQERQPAALGFDTPVSAGSSNQTELGGAVKVGSKPS